MFCPSWMVQPGLAVQAMMHRQEVGMSRFCGFRLDVLGLSKLTPPGLDTSVAFSVGVRQLLLV